MISNGVEIIFFTFKRPIRVEVVTYRFDAALGSLHMHRLHGFDELRNDQEMIQSRSAKRNITVVLFIGPHHFSFFSFRKF
jgi:hypothetical protein